MKTEILLVENIKCHGCMNTIKNALLKDTKVSDVQIDKDEEKITLQTEEGFDKDAALKTLKSLGYPEKGKNNIGAKAISYVSCAVGRIQN